MKHVNNKLVCSSVIALFLMLSLGGCAGSGIKIVAVPGQEVLALNADEVIQIMSKVGFSSEQIEEHAWDFREGLARSGEVRVYVNDSIEAACAIRGNVIFITSRTRGQFVFDVNTGQFLNMNDARNMSTR